MSIEVVARMEDVRAQRLEHEAMALMPQRWAALEDAGHELLERQFAKQPELLAYGLNIADLALQDEFRALLCSPPDVPVDGAAFLALDGQMDVIVERWTGHVREALRELVVQAKAVTKRSKGIDPLDLAMMVFGPKDNAVAGDWCRFFPSVANERVLRTAGAELGRAVSPYEEFIYAKSPGPFCDTAGTRLCGPQPTSFVRRVIRMAGLRGDTATAAEMDALDLRWLDHDGFVYTWRELVSTLEMSKLPRVPDQTSTRSLTTIATASLRGGVRRGWRNSYRPDSEESSVYKTGTIECGRAFAATKHKLAGR